MVEYLYSILEALGFILSFASKKKTNKIKHCVCLLCIGVIKHHDQKQLGEVFDLQITVYHQGKPRQALKQEPRSRH